MTNIEHGPDSKPGMYPEIDFTFYNGDQPTDLTLNQGNTTIKRFEQGNGAYDHVVVSLGGNHVGVIRLTDELAEILAANQFPVSPRQRLDDFEMDCVAKFQLAELDDDLSREL
jgi:hypothetical protein